MTKEKWSRKRMKDGKRARLLVCKTYSLRSIVIEIKIKAELILVIIKINSHHFTLVTLHNNKNKKISKKLTIVFFLPKNNVFLPLKTNYLGRERLCLDHLFIYQQKNNSL
jgi:hypothetical protein